MAMTTDEPLTAEWAHNRDGVIRPPPSADRRQANQPGYIMATDYATGYLSPFTQLLAQQHTTAAHDPTDLLSHLNCSFFSCSTAAPTLLSLKQHAQALTVLIKHLSVGFATEVDARKKTKHAKNSKEAETGPEMEIDDPELEALVSGASLEPDSYLRYHAFDWLDDLTTPYTSDDPDHLRPLNALRNHVHSQNDVTGPQYHCALRTFTAEGPRRPGEPKHPYASHHNLVMHANECLEMLDHEYSASGGIMSVLPTEQEYDTAALSAARNSLFGQWVLFSQHLVARTHELELAYANTLDLLKGEALVPRQHLSATGPLGFSTGREIAYPQDRWVLANAGDDVFEHLHRLLDQQEAQIDAKEAIYRASGTVGDRQWIEERGGKWYAAGVVPVDLTTRYYRVRDSPNARGTIFVLPAWEAHPGVEGTRRIESRPTVVATAQPVWPTRISDWEAKNRRAVDESVGKDIAIGALKKDRDARDRQLGLLKSEFDRTSFLVKQYETNIDPLVRNKIKNYAACMTLTRNKLLKFHEKLIASLQHKLTTDEKNVVDKELADVCSFLSDTSLDDFDADVEPNGPEAEVDPVLT